MNKNVVEKTLQSIDNIDRLTDLAAISIYNTSYEALDKYDIMQEHATPEYVNEEFIQESVLAGVLIGAGIIGVAVSAFFIIKKIIDSGAKGDKSKKDSSPVAGVDLTKPEEAKKFLTTKVEEIKKWTEGSKVTIKHTYNKAAATEIANRIKAFSEAMVAVIDANGAEDIKRATDTLNNLDPTLPALLEEKEQPIDKTTNLFDLVDIECFTILAEAYKELEKRVADVEKQMKNKTKKEGAAEETEAVDAELQKTVKEKCNQFTNNVAKVIKDERGWMEELQTAVHNVQQAPAPAKEEPAAAETGTPAAENKGTEAKPAEAKDNGNPESSTNDPESLKGQLNAAQAKAQSQQTSDLNGEGTPAGGSLEGVQTPPTTGIDQPTSREQKRQQTQAELSEYNKLNEERAELENQARYTNTENAALKNYMIKLGVDNDKINEYLYKTYINDKQGLIDNLRVLADNTGVSTDELDRIAEMISNNSKKVPINTEAPSKETTEPEPKPEPKPSVDPSSLTAKVDAIENNDAELNKICVMVYPKSAVTNPENTRTKVKDMLETIAVYFDEGEQDKVIDEIIKSAVAKCNTDGTQNKKAFVNAYADMYKRYSICAKVLGVTLPAAKPEKIDNDERINSYFTKGVDATNAEYDAKEAPTPEPTTEPSSEPSTEEGKGFDHDYSADNPAPTTTYSVPQEIIDANPTADVKTANQLYNQIMTNIADKKDVSGSLNDINNISIYSPATKKTVFDAIKQAHPEINVPTPTSEPTPAPTAEPTEEPRQLNAALNMPVNNAQEALRRRNETKAQAELNRYASLAAAAKTKVTPQVLEGLAMEVIDKAKAADRGENVKGNAADIKSSLKNIYSSIAGSWPFRLGASKEKKDALALARTYLHDRMAAEGVDKYFVEMEEPEITYQNLIMECDIAIAREEKLKLITEQN